MQLRNQPVIAAEKLFREQTLSPIQIPTNLKDIYKQLKLSHRMVDLVDCQNRKRSVTLLRYNMDKPESSYAQVQCFAVKNEEGNFQQIVLVNYKLDDFIYLPDVMNSVF